MSTAAWIVAVSEVRGTRSRWDVPMSLRVIRAPDAATAERLARGRGWRDRVAEAVQVNCNRRRATRAAVEGLRAGGTELTPASSYRLGKLDFPAGGAKGVTK